MTPAQLAAYRAKRCRESRERAALTRRYHAVMAAMGCHYDTLTHWEHLVEHLEGLLTLFQAQEAQDKPCRESGFMQELMAEEPALWGEQIRMAASPQQ